MGKKLDLKGQVFGRLSVIEETDRNPKYPNQRNWRCLCSCGNTAYGRSARLRSGHKQSCGCLHVEHMNAFKTRNRRGFRDIPGAYWSSVQHNARRRGIVFDITIETAWSIYEHQAGRCAISGLHIPFSKKGRVHDASLDRKDNDQRYMLTNVWWVHKDINIMKKNHSLSYLLELCQAVAQYQEGACSLL